MPRTCLLLLLVIALSVCAVAADSPSAEIFGGYSYFRADTNGSSSLNMNGWDVALTVPFHKYLGVTADLSGQYATASAFSTSGTFHEYNFLFGPTVIARNPSKFTPFARVMFGASRLSGTGFAASDDSFAVAFGGGIDYKVFSVLSLRPVQLDWVRTSHFSTSQNNFRYAVGAVINF